MWFTETAWPPMIVLMVGAAILMAVWSSSRRGIHLAAAGLLLCGCGVVYFVEQQIVTERERVEVAIFGVAEAFEAADTDATIDYFSQSAFGLRLTIQGVMDVMEVRVQDDLRITDVDIEMLSEDTRARTHLRANGTISVGGFGDIGHQPTRWNLTWQKEGGEWKIIDVERLDPVRGDSMELLSGASG